LADLLPVLTQVALKFTAEALDPFAHLSRKKSCVDQFLLITNEIFNLV